MLCILDLHEKVLLEGRDHRDSSPLSREAWAALDARYAWHWIDVLQIPAGQVNLLLALPSRSQTHLSHFIDTRSTSFSFTL